MRYRTLSPTGDYTFGQGGGNFLVNSPAAVLQAIDTRLKLATGEWFLDKTEGTPYSTEILGAGTENTRDLAFQERILETQGVVSISNYTSSFDARTRKFSFSVDVTTIYGTVTYNGVF